MKLVSINVGMPREVEWRGKTVRTSIFKSPVTGPVAVRRENLDGDRQSDLTVHGGVDKAVYAYPMEHYAFWSAELPGVALPWGSFGENLTTQGLVEDAVHVGDRLLVGGAELVVTQPRIPCFKLGIRFERPDMVKRFLDSRRSGFYLAVRREGEVAAGDAVRFVAGPGPRVSVRELVDLYAGRVLDRELAKRAIELPDLAQVWRDELCERLSRKAD